MNKLDERANPGGDDHHEFGQRCFTTFLLRPIGELGRRPFLGDHMLNHPSAESKESGRSGRVVPSAASASSQFQLRHTYSFAIPEDWLGMEIKFKTRTQAVASPCFACHIPDRCIRVSTLSA